MKQKDRDSERLASSLAHAEMCLRAVAEKFDCGIVLRFGESGVAILQDGVYEGENLIGQGENLTLAIAAALVKELGS